MKKRLLVTASTFPRWKGDTEPRFILDLSKALLKYFDVTVLVPATIGAKDIEVLEGVKVIRYHYLPIHKWETLCYPGAIMPRIKEKKIRILQVPFLFFSLYWTLKKILPEYDVVHAHWLIPQGIVQSFFEKNYIITGHGGDVTSLNKGVIKKLKIRALKRASYVTTVSNALKKEMLNLDKDISVTVRSMGVNCAEFSPEYRVGNYFNQMGGKVILFVGRLAEKKGVSYLIEAMKEVDAKLVIVGKGTLETELKRQAQEQGSKIIFLGAKTHEELKVIYASADIFVAPSITAKDGDKEGFGLVFLEAMASGLPVIGSNSGGIPDIVQNGINGFLTEEKNAYDIANKINFLLAHQDIYEQIRHGAIETAKNYDYSVIADEYKNILFRCL